MCIYTKKTIPPGSEPRRGTRRPFGAGTRWIFRINLGRYARILVIDPSLNSLSDEEVLAFFDLAQVPVEVVHLALGLFRDTMARHSR